MNSLIPPLIDLLGLHQKDPLPMEQRMYHAKTTAWIGCIFALVFALFNMFIEAQMVLGLIELGVVVVLLVPAILASGSAHNIQRSEFLLLTATVVIFSALTVLGSIDGSGLFWVFAVPFVAFFLGGQRKGWWYSGSFFVTAVVYFLWVAPHLTFAYQYPARYVLHFFLALSFYTLTAAAFNQQRTRFEKELQQRVDDKAANSNALLNQLQYQATHDDLTGLSNEVLLSEILTHEIHQAQHAGYGIAVCHIHLQRFYELCNALGTGGSEKLVRHIATYLKQIAHDHGPLARTGRDEFVMLYRLTEGVTEPEAIAHFLAERQLSIEQDGYSLYIEFIVGLAVYPAHGQDSHALLHKAEQAMLQARKNGAQWNMYDIQQDQVFVRHHLLFGKLREALQKNRLQVYFQPQIDLRSGQVVGAEALTRWNDPVDGEIPPAIFIPVAEESGAIRMLTTWLIGECMQECAEWQRMGLDLELSINLSASNLLDPDLLGVLMAGLATSGLYPQSITLEITESCFMNSPDRAMEILRRIHNSGFKLSIDDFGTGYSSLSYLKALPMNELKIDKSFVFKLLQSRGDQAIVASTIELAHNLGLAVVAEGIEDEATALWLQERGCDIGQGFYLARPMPAAEFLEFVGSRNTTHRAAETIPCNLFI
jgi:diguanylate cyclase (GGDEF)-like protein